MNVETISESSRPSQDSLELVGRLAQEVVDEEGDLAEWARDYVSRFSRRIAYDIDYVRMFIAPHERVLECGSTPLLTTACLKRLNLDYVGLDIDPERFISTIDRLALDVRQCNIELENLPFPDGHFDGVLFFELFEHLRIDPVFTMQELHRVLRPGGKLLLSTPNLRSLQGIYNFIFRNQAYSCSADVYAQYSKLHTLGHMGHVREYTFCEIQQFLKHIGFRTKSLIHRGQFPSKLMRSVTSFFPSLRPFMTVAAIKQT